MEAHDSLRSQTPTSLAPFSIRSCLRGVNFYFNCVQVFHLLNVYCVKKNGLDYLLLLSFISGASIQYHNLVCVPTIVDAEKYMTLKIPTISYIIQTQSNHKDFHLKILKTSSDFLQMYLRSFPFLANICNQILFAPNAEKKGDYTENFHKKHLNKILISFA